MTNESPVRPLILMPFDENPSSHWPPSSSSGLHSCEVPFWEVKKYNRFRSPGSVLSINGPPNCISKSLKRRQFGRFISTKPAQSVHAPATLVNRGSEMVSGHHDWLFMSTIQNSGRQFEQSTHSAAHLHGLRVIRSVAIMIYMSHPASVGQ